MKEFIYGRNAVYETLRAKRREFFGLEVADGVKETGRITEILELAALHRVGAKLVPKTKLERLKANHQGVALEVGDYPYSDLVEILERAREKNEQPFILMLDSLQDPQNFGSLLRTAEVVGVHGVVIPLARTVEVTPAVVNASSGASEHLLVAHSNLSQAMDALKESEVWIAGLDAKGQALNESTKHYLQAALGLIVGSEGEGLRELTRKKCDMLLRLPMRGQIESLNAAVAGSIVLYEAYLARNK
jgi:23S rRNA (guanosine2251-2'-O)-methyltransferase